VAFFTDQPFWAHAMHKIGVGAKPISYYTLKEEDVLEGVKYCESEEVRKKAQEIGARVKGEDGGKEAARLMEKFLESYGKK